MTELRSLKSWLKNWNSISYIMWTMKLLERSSRIKLRQSLGKAERCWAIKQFRFPDLFREAPNLCLWGRLSWFLLTVKECKYFKPLLRPWAFWQQHWEFSQWSRKAVVSVTAAFKVSRWLISGALMGGYGSEWEHSLMAKRGKMDSDSGVWWISCLPSSLNGYCEAQDVKNRRCHWERDTGDRPCLSA